MVYLGADLHHKRSVVTALAEDGTVVVGPEGAGPLQWR
jgi:hypothetical protein